MSSNLKELINQFLLASKLNDKLLIVNTLICTASLDSRGLKGVLAANHSLIFELWEYLKPDGIKRRDGIDESKVLLQIHLCSLKLLTMIHKNLNVDTPLFNGDNLQYVFEFLAINSNSMHDQCCAKALDDMWVNETIEKARKIMIGQVYSALMELSGEAYNIILQNIETQENVVEILSKECDLNVNNLSFNLSSSHTISEIVKVVHVINPEFVWVQELTEDLNELNKYLEEHITHAKLANPGNCNTIVRYKRLLFRAQVVRWCDKTALIFAIDYGWEVEVDRKNVFQTEDHIAEMPPLAKLCRIINVYAPCKMIEFQRHTIQLLQTYTKRQHYVGEILQHKRISSVVHLLKISRNSSLVCDILLLFSQCSFHHNNRELVGDIILLPVIQSLKRWSFCTEVQAMGFECVRNMLFNTHKNRDIFILNGGLELTFHAYATYKHEHSVNEHVLHVIKCCLHGFEFDYAANCDTNVKSYCNESNSYLQNSSEFTNEFSFSHLSNFSQYSSKYSGAISFLNDVSTHQELIEFSREVVSHLNSSKGGTVFIGVTCQKLINAIQMNRSRKDEYRTKLDMVFTKMITDHNFTELPEQLFRCIFEKVKNTHNRAMPADTVMYVIRVMIGESKNICRLRDGEGNVFFNRQNGCVTPIAANLLRQSYSKISTSGQPSPDSVRKDYIEPIHSNLEYSSHQLNDALPRRPQILNPAHAFKVPDLFTNTFDENFFKTKPDTISNPPPLISISQLQIDG